MMRLPLLVFLFLLSSLASAEQVSAIVSIPKPVVVDVRANIPKGKRAGRWDVALIIANRNYQRPGVPAVDFAHEDADALKTYLHRTMGFAKENIIVLKDAGKTDMEIWLGTSSSHRGKLHRYVRKGKSRVFVYYTGHGAPDIDPSGRDNYLVPIDGDPNLIAVTGYPLSTFYQNLGRLPAKDLVVLDSCFSGQTQNGLLFKNVSPAMLKVRSTPANLKTGSVLHSAAADQLSTWYPKKRHSMFTYFFLKGLQGAADKNKDGRVTTGEMAGYVAEEVAYMAGRVADKTQTPSMEGRKDIVLATYE